LFDEVEKAHTDVLNVLLQVLDDGRLTDGQGRTVDFSNTVIILTSNVGAEFMQTDNMGVLPQPVQDMVMQQVRLRFRPEFLNRLDDIILFNPLSQANLFQIVRLQLEVVCDLLKSREIRISLDDSAIITILKEAYNPAYGARPIRRYLEKAIVTQLSLMILSPTNPLKNGSNIIVYDKNAAPQGSVISKSLGFFVEDKMIE
jgi:ATP-dependent Clp protease ATP-binding subunit ClpB